MQAERLQTEAKNILPADKQLAMKFSKVWLDRFQNSRNIKFRRVHGEALIADDDSLQQALLIIRAKVSEYGSANVCNADEFRLFFPQNPGCTLSERLTTGQKRTKLESRFGVLQLRRIKKFPLIIVG
eukprot:IDg14355t1